MSAKTKLFNDLTENSENIFTPTPTENKLSHKCEKRKENRINCVCFSIFLHHCHMTSPKFARRTNWRLWRYSARFQFSIHSSFSSIQLSLFSHCILVSKSKKKCFSSLTWEYFLLYCSRSPILLFIDSILCVFRLHGFQHSNPNVYINFACRLYQTKAGICFYIHDLVERRSLLLLWFFVRARKIYWFRQVSPRMRKFNFSIIECYAIGSAASSVESMKKSFTENTHSN